MSTRKKYSKEFKLDAVTLVLDQGYSRIEAARSLDVNTQMLGRWIQKFQAGGNGHAFRGNGKLTGEQDEIRAWRLNVLVRLYYLNRKWCICTSPTGSDRGSRPMRRSIRQCTRH